MFRSMTLGLAAAFSLATAASATMFVVKGDITTGPNAGKPILIVYDLGDAEFSPSPYPLAPGIDQEFYLVGNFDGFYQIGGHREYKTNTTELFISWGPDKLSFDFEEEYYNVETFITGGLPSYGLSEYFRGPVTGLGRVQDGQFVPTFARLGDAIPEPSSWALMIAGFGLAGSAVRARRRAAIA